MLRPATPADVPDIIDLVVTAGLFTRDEASFIATLLPTSDGSTFLVDTAADGDGLAAVLLYRPEEAADRVYDLTMITVRPELHGRGRGTELMRHVEQDLRARGQRLLLIRTSSTSPYDRTRAFYRRLGYAEQPPVPDYWADGDDLVMYTARL